MRLWRSVFLVVAAATAALVLGSCSAKKETAGPKPAKKQFTVGVTLLTEEHPFYRELKSAFIEQCKTAQPQADDTVLQHGPAHADLAG